MIWVARKGFRRARRKTPFQLAAIQIEQLSLPAVAVTTGSAPSGQEARGTDRLTEEEADFRGGGSGPSEPWTVLRVMLTA